MNASVISMVRKNCKNDLRSWCFTFGGAIIEAKYDEKNEIMKWPTSVSPYDCSIIPLLNKNDNSN